MGTHYPTQSDIKRGWHVVDLEGQTLGRAASQIASILRGKHKVTFTPHLDVGDYVICVNADKIKLTGNKLDASIYAKYTGYIGNLKVRTVREMLERNPELVITYAIKRMLPKNALGRQTLSKLKVYAGTEHPHSAQQPQTLELN